MYSPDSSPTLPLSCRGLLVEGGAFNLITSPDLVTDGVKVTDASSWVLYDSGELGRVPTWRAALGPGGVIEISIPVSFSGDDLNLTASCYCWSMPRRASSILVEIETSGNSIRHTFRTDEPAQRFHVSLPTPEGSCHALVRYVIRNTESVDCIANLAFPSVERSAFASSPVHPGEQRSPELMDINDGSIFGGAASGAMFLTFFPLLDSHKWNTKKDGCVIGGLSNDSSFGIEVFISGSTGKLGLSIADGDVRRRIELDNRPMADCICGIALLWNGPQLELMVDGNPTAKIDDLRRDLRDLAKVRIGNHPADCMKPAHIVVRRIQSFRVRLEQWEAQAVFAELEPERYRHYTPILNRLLEANIKRWPSDLLGLLMKIPTRWQSLPPLWASNPSDEGVFRDDVANMIGLLSWTASPESKCIDGRTDLLAVDNQGRRIRLEFKIWGRNDYADVPLKPMKYMTEDEDVCVVIMLNKNKSTIDREYVRNVIAGPTNCQRHIEVPFGDSAGPFHFISEHEVSGRRIHVFHIVFNLHKPVNRSTIIQTLGGDAN